MSVSAKILKGHEVGRIQGRPRAVIVGNGADGASQAIELLEAGCDACLVNPIQDAHLQDSSPSIWRPSFVSDSNPDVLRQIFKSSFQRLLTLNASAFDAGIQLIHGYEFHSSFPAIPLWSDAVFGFRRAHPAEIKLLCPHAKHGFAYTTVLIDQSKYNAFLHDHLKALGGTEEMLDVTTLSDAAMIHVQNRDTLTTAHRADFIVDCYGLSPSESDQPAAQPKKVEILKVFPSKPCDSRFFILDFTVESRPVYLLPTPASDADKYKPVDRTDPAHAQLLRRFAAAMPWLPAARVALAEVQEPVRLEQSVGVAGGRRGGPAAARGAEVRGAAKPSPLTGAEQMPVLRNLGQGAGGACLHWGLAGLALAEATRAGLLMSVCKL